MLYNKFKLEAIPKPIFAHIYSCPGYESKLKKKALPNVEIAYVKKGQIKIDIMGERYVARENSFIIIPRNHESVIHTSKNEPHIHYTISALVDTDVLVEKENVQKNNDEIIIPLIVEPFEYSQKCELLLHEAINEYQNPSSQSKLKSGAIVAQILCELSGERTSNDTKISENANILDGRIKKYIELNISSKILLQDIGDALGKNANYLNQIFKKINGMPIMSYINLEKMKKAAVLISDKGYNVKDAAKAVGINDINYFSRLFKRKMGMTISQYKSSSVDFTYSLTEENK